MSNTNTHIQMSLLANHFLCDKVMSTSGHVCLPCLVRAWHDEIEQWRPFVIDPEYHKLDIEAELKPGNGTWSEEAFIYQYNSHKAIGYL